MRYAEAAPERAGAYVYSGPHSEERGVAVSMPVRYFEDFAPGDTYELGSVTLTREKLLEFAREYDPQPIHLDDERARESVFGGLIASGWQTVALFMRLFVDGLLNSTVSMASPGIDELRWLRPVRPGDTLRARVTILEATPSLRRMDRGTIRSSCEMLNQHDETVFRMIGMNILGRRPPSGTDNPPDRAHTD